MKESRQEIQRRRQDEKEARRNSILDAAEEVIGRIGWEATNFGEIAKVSNLSRSLIYVYFPTKSDVFHAMCNRGAAVLRRIFSEALSATNPATDPIEMLGRAYFRFAREYPIYFKFHAAQHGGESHEPGSPQEQAFTHPAFDIFYRVLEQGVNAGAIRLPAGNLKATALAVWAFTHGLLSIATNKEDFLRRNMGLPPAELVDHGFGLLRGMLASPKPD